MAGTLYRIPSRFHLRIARPEGGSALICVLLFSAIMLFVAAASVTSIKFQSTQTERSLAYKQALALAEAGAERGLVALNAAENQWAGWTSAGATRSLLNQPLTDHHGHEVGKYSVTVTDVTGDRPVIESVGTVLPRSGMLQSRRIRVPTVGSAADDPEPDLPSIPSPWGNYGLQSTAGVIVNSNSSNDAYNSNNGRYGLAGNSGLPTKMAAAANVILNSNARVGDVQAGGTITRNSNVQHGTLQANNAPTAPPPFPDAALAAAKTANSNHLMRIYKVTGQNKDLKHTGVPLHGDFNFNNLNINGKMRIEMPSGTYFLKSLQINSNAEIVPIGPVTLYIDGNGIIMNSNTTINAEDWIPPGATQPQPPKPSNFQTFVKSGSVIFNSNYTMYAGLYAPSANLAIFNSNCQFYGVVVGKGLTLNSNSHIHIDLSMLQAAVPEPETTPEGAGGGYLAQCWTEIGR